MKLIVEAAAERFDGPVLVREEDRQSVNALRRELDEYYEMCRQFHEMEPDQVLLQVSGIAARLVEMRAFLVRSGSQRANKFRTSEVDPLLDHLKAQAVWHSRLISVRALDLEMSGRQPC